MAPKSWCSSYPSPCKVRRALLISSPPGGVPTRVEIMTAASILTRQQEVPCGRAKMRNRSLQLYHPQIPTHISFHRFRLLPSWIVFPSSLIFANQILPFLHATPIIPGDQSEAAILCVLPVLILTVLFCFSLLFNIRLCTAFAYTTSAS